MVKLSSKNKFLLSGLVVLLVLSYLFSFRKAFSERKKFYLLKKQQSLVEQIPQKLVQLKKQNKVLDSIFDKHHFSAQSSFQNNLLQRITDYTSAKNIKIVSFHEPHVFSENSSLLYSYSFSLSGSYTELVKFIHFLEQKNNFGKLASVSFVKKQDYKTNRSYLVCSVVLQRVESE